TRMSATARIVLAGLAVMLAAAAAAGQKPPPGGPPPDVSAHRGADLRAAVAALNAAAPGAVAADATAVARSLERELAREPLRDALQQVSLDFDRFWVRRGRSLVLQRRYSEAAESPGLEVEELRAVARDLWRLVAPACPTMSLT